MLGTAFRKIFFSASACLVLTFSLPSRAQKITGDIAGTIMDSSGAVVANVTVTVVNKGTGVSRAATTNASGNYRIAELAIGDYKVTAGASGFKTVVRDAMVSSGAVTTADFALAIGQMTETVEVEGAAPLVELSPNNNNYVDAAKIESVPLNGRDFNSLLAITPGVQRAPGGGFLAVSINGSRTTSNNYFIDGLYNNDRYYGDSAIGQTGVVGIPAIIFPPEAIAELSVQETPSAEFGVKGGAPILLGMKSGTNEFHGWVNWVNHSGFGDASNYFTKHQGCDTEGECDHAPIHNNQFGAGIGGPIIKDKTFFLLYYEGQRYKASAVSSRIVPTTDDVNAARADIAAKGLTVDPVGETLLGFFPIDTTGTGFFTANTPTTATADSFGIKVDHHIGNTHSFSGKYIFGDSLQSAPPFAGLPAGGDHPADLFNSIAPSRAQMGGLSWTWNISGNKILESRLGYTRFAQIIDVNNKIDPASLGVDTGPLAPGDFGVPYVYLYPLTYGGYIGGVQAYPITTRPDQTWDWSEHFSWVKGNHTIKLGGNFQQAYTNSLRNRARTGMAVGYFTYYTSPDTAVRDSVESLLLGKADTASRNFGDTHRHIYQNSVGFYAQDDWKITPRLTLSYGLRYDLNGALSEKNDIGSNYLPGVGFQTLGSDIDRLYDLDLKDFGPHAGFAWDPFGNGKTAVRGGYSMTYDLWNFAALAAPYTFAGARAGAFSQPNLGQFSSTSVSLAASEGSNGVFPNDPAATCYNPDSGEGDYICFSQGAIFGSNPQGSPPYNAFSVVPDFKTPRIHNFSLSIQQEVARNNAITIGYSGTRGDNLVMYRDLNASPLGSDCTNGPTCDEFRPISAAGDQGLRHIIQATNSSKSQYDSLQMSYNQRGWHGLNTQYNFTWSKCYDYNSTNRGGAGDYPQADNPFSPKDSYGLCDHDVRLNFNAGGVYSVPDIPGLGQRLGKGWQFSSIYTGISGRPFTVLLGGGNDPTGQGMNGSSIRAAWDGTPIHYNTRNPDQYLDQSFTGEDQVDPCGRTGPADGDNPGHFKGGLPLSPFYTPCAGTLGNSRRNQLIGPGLSQWDMTLIKDTKITERVTLQLRWEVFNLLNRANFHYFPNNTLGDGFGQITKTSDVASGNPVIAQGGPRNMNFGLKLIF